jgi:uncharacterized protein (TIGR02453 family)
VFSGFPPEAMTFFRGLARNNNRDWFQPRKEIYETKVKAPMCELVEAINAEMLKFAPDYINDPKKAIYRIYRDTRFSKDKTPYKTHIAAVFPRRGLEKHAGAGLYFSISPQGIEIAGGVYMPGPEQLLAIRTWLAENHAEFRKASRGPEKLMGKLYGDSLQRVPKGFDAAHPAASLIKMKQWLYDLTLDAKLATSAKLAPEILKRFRAMAPVLELLNTPLRAKIRNRQPAMIADLF